MRARSPEQSQPPSSIAARGGLLVFPVAVHHHRRRACAARPDSPSGTALAADHVRPRRPRSAAAAGRRWRSAGRSGSVGELCVDHRRGLGEPVGDREAHAVALDPVALHLHRHGRAAGDDQLERLERAGRSGPPPRRARSASSAPRAERDSACSARSSATIRAASKVSVGSCAEPGGDHPERGHHAAAAVEEGHRVAVAAVVVDAARGARTGGRCSRSRRCSARRPWGSPWCPR